MKKMTFDNKRKLIQTAFSGLDSQGNRLGVYLTKPDKAVEPVTYTIKGIFKDVQGHFPMFEKEIEKEDMLGLYRENSFVEL